MGVQGLWQLLDPLGRPVSLESLENKILAIDASIWLHQAVHGFRDKSNNPLPNAHLLGLFNRVCKLLFYGIKPVFVFDGAVPFLKRQTMSKRRDRQQNASRDAEKTYQQILNKYIQSKAIKDALGKESKKSDANSSTLSEVITKKPNTDLFDLPPLPSTSQPEIRAPRLNENSDDEDDIDEVDDDLYADPMSARISAYQDVDTIDFEAEDFKSLPLEIQHELLLEMKERNKRRYWINHEPLPEKAEEIGNFQIKQLLYRRKLQSKIEGIKKDLSATLTRDLAFEQGIGAYGDEHILESKRISSEDSTHYILFKSVHRDFSKPKSDASLTSTASSSTETKHAALKSKTENPVTLSRNMWLKSISAAPISPVKLYMKNNATLSEDVSSASDFVALDDGTVHEDVSQSSDSSELNSLNQNIVTNESVKNALIHITESGSSIILDNCSASDGICNIENVSKESASVDFETAKKEPSRAEVYLAAPEINNLEKTKEDVLKSESFDPFDEKNAVHLIANDESTLKVNLNHPTLDPTIIVKPDNIAVVQLISSSEDEDDFIEVEINPATIKDDELFPLEVFQNPVSDTDALETFDKPCDIPEIVERIPAVPEFEIIPNQDRTDLLLLSEELDRQTESLLQDKGRQERIAATITEQMYSESQELLKLFGIPFVISPAEAEAQCATMDMLELTDGTITDDSDVWLFGAQKVYKNFFENNRDVMFFNQADVTKRLKLDRSKLIAVALLTGSDYTDGIKGVGIVTALEILAEFREIDGFESLQKLSTWWKTAQEQKVAPSETKVKQKLRKLALSEGFPSNDVLKAYLEPLVDSSTERFSWACPDLDALRQFANSKLNWTKEKADGMLLPIIKRLNTAKERQLRIDSYFPAASRSEQGVKHKSRRLNRALMKVGSLADSQEACGSKQTRKNVQAKRGGCATRKRNFPSKANHTEDLGLSESSDSASSEEERVTKPPKRKSLPSKRG